MSRMIFVNLPTADLAKADAFYEGLGFTKNEMFSDSNATSWMISDTITVMVLHRDFFASFLIDGDTPTVGSGTREVLNALSADSRSEVDDFVAKAVAGGGAVYREASEPFEGMYQAAVKDPDGHVWEIAWMSQEAMQDEA
ncbi:MULTISPECIES: VOC family protein [Glutamicibacter]|uniref:Lactoylglutathione lyase n=1 Tax=Glutamicibacter creatinolyticus TaxID=162496 RepID=A0A5B7WWL5_9MICC|nr:MULTISPECIES: VOC family protein [Glutamicibacter]QCY48292.1 Lactoylglutathione lyase [Glutamicibacter creatinolyticus]TLK52671.1 lactoylglutathione lyase [Glutamicibacter sp. V16R2B1]